MDRPKDDLHDKYHNALFVLCVVLEDIKPRVASGAFPTASFSGRQPARLIEYAPCV
jgi:hypothetical protein